MFGTSLILAYFIVLNLLLESRFWVKILQCFIVLCISICSEVRCRLVASWGRNIQCLFGEHISKRFSCFLIKYSTSCTFSFWFYVLSVVGEIINFFIGEGSRCFLFILKSLTLPKSSKSSLFKVRNYEISRFRRKVKLLIRARTWILFIAQFIVYMINCSGA